MSSSSEHNILKYLSEGFKGLSDDLAVNSQLKKWFNQFVWNRKIFTGVMDAIPVALLLLNSQNKVIFSNQPAEKYFNLKSKWSKQSFIPVLNAVKYSELTLALKTLFEKSSENENTLVSVEFKLFTHYMQDILIHLFHYHAEPNTNLPWLKSGKLKVLTFLDVTEWKNQQLKKSQEKSIVSLNTLTAGIAHEIKNPLGSIDLHLQLMSRFIKRKKIEDKEELEELVTIVNEEITRLESIVNDFLVSFRPMRPVKKSESLNQIIKNTVTLLTPRFKKNKIKLSLDLDTKILPYFFDKNQIKQVLINLTQNSIEAILENKKLTGDGEITIKTKEHKQKLILTISDNGIGIPSHLFSDILQPFYTTKKMGTGLGLSIVGKIIQDHDGALVFNQDKKGGAELLIEFLRIKSNLLLK